MNSFDERSIIIRDIFTDLTKVNPHKIIYAAQANYAKGLFSPLVRLKDDGSFEGVIASNFYWEGNSLVFEVDGAVKTHLGRPILARDVYQSLLWSMKTKSTHGSITQLLDHEQCSKIEDCIRLSGNKILIDINKSYQNYALQLLSNTESLIILNEFKEDGANPRKNFEETTGAYYISKWEEESVTLSANKNHPFYHQDMPQNVIVTSDESIQRSDILKRQDMVIPSYRRIEINQFKENLDKLNIFKTQEIKLIYLKFTDQGMKNLSLERRLLLGKKIGKVHLENRAKDTSLRPYNYLFSELYFGSLRQDQKRAIEELDLKIREKLDQEKGEGIHVSASKKAIQTFYQNELSEKLPQMKITLEEGTFSGEYGDFALFMTDMGFYEDFSFLNYFISSTSNKSEEFRKDWMKNYMLEEDKEAKNQLLQDLHFDILMEGRVIPIAYESYFIISSKQWHIEKSELFADTPFWRFRYNP